MLPMAPDVLQPRLVRRPRTAAHPRPRLVGKPPQAAWRLCDLFRVRDLGRVTATCGGWPRSLLSWAHAGPEVTAVVPLRSGRSWPDVAPAWPQPDPARPWIRTWNPAGAHHPR